MTEKRGPGRPPMNRPDPHPQDHRERAKARAAQIMEHIGSLDENTGEFYIDPSVIPADYTYEWKAYSVLGAVDPSKQIELARTGWEPVPTARHPEMMPADTKEKVIMRKGNMLMERPEEITKMVKDREYRAARQQVKAKEEALNQAPAGTLERANKGNSLARVSKSFVPMPVSD